MNFSQRLKAIIKISQEGMDAFAEKTGVSRRMLFNYTAGNNSPPAEFFQAVKQAFPWVNIEWLITGIGEMKVPVVQEGDGDYVLDRPPPDVVTQKILLMLKEMPEEKRREVLKYTEFQKQLTDYERAGSGGGTSRKRDQRGKG